VAAQESEPISSYAELQQQVAAATQRANAWELQSSKLQFQVNGLQCKLTEECAVSAAAMKQVVQANDAKDVLEQKVAAMQRNANAAMASEITQKDKQLAQASAAHKNNVLVIKELQENLAQQQAAGLITERSLATQEAVNALLRQMVEGLKQVGGVDGLGSDFCGSVEVWWVWMMS
jgi:uncharacterized lipoprotein